MNMKRYFCIVILMLLNNFCFSQLNQVSEENRSVLRKLSNKKVIFSISNLVNITDSSGAVISRRRIVLLEDKYLRKIKRLFANENLLNDLFLLLSDSDRDWSANVLLYAITKSSAVTLKGYESNGYESWRKISRDKDIEKWKKYFNR